MTFGLALHVGWAIEGPIGSDYKVDASYLSPHVNLTMTLEAATKIYGVPFLMSEKYYNMLSVRTKERVRKVDIVLFANAPQGLYTFSLNDTMISAPKKHVIGEVIKIESLEVEPTIVEEDGAEYLFMIDQDVMMLQSNLPEKVYCHFREAQCHWVLGEWSEAKEFCERALEIDPNDGPTKAMIRFMARTHYEPPTDWLGYRLQID